MCRIFNSDLGKQALRQKDIVLEKLSTIEIDALHNWHNHLKVIIPINMAKHLLAKSKEQLLEMNFNHDVSLPQHKPLAT